VAAKYWRNEGDDQRPVIPYGKQKIDHEDIQAVVEVLQSDWLTTGPKVEEFEHHFADHVGVKYAVAVNSGTAALHASMYAIGIEPGDEVIVSPMTFAASANCIVFQGGVPVFADIDPDTLLIDPQRVEEKITSRTKAIIAIDYAGQPCDYDKLKTVAEHYDLKLIDDACHALGGTYKKRPVGSLADLNAFSFHPVKHITTGEGGMITTDDSGYAKRMRCFRNHGITTDHRERSLQGAWFYEMVDLGYNYRLTDIQCALGLSQLLKLPQWIILRQEIAGRYREAFEAFPGIKLLSVRPDISHAYHLFVIRLNVGIISLNRDEVFRALREKGIGVNVHYIPVYFHPYYRKRFGTVPGLCPVAERAYEEIISLPIFPSMSDKDVQTVIDAVKQVVL
jgi:perosamine synthetase